MAAIRMLTIDYAASKFDISEYRKPKRTPKQRPFVIAKLRKLAFRFIRATN